MSPLCANGNPNGTTHGTPNPAGRATATSRSSLAGKARSRIIALAALALVAGLIVGRPAPAAADVTPVGTQVTVQDLCGTPLPGQARCLGERRISSTRAATMGLSPASTPGGLGPADLADAYQLDQTKGYGQTVAIVDAYDDPTAATDLAAYRSQYGLPPCGTSDGCFRKVNQSGTASPLPVANAGWAGEISLDLDMVSAVCPLCTILLVEANSSYLSDLGTAVDTAVRLGAKFVSNSYGGGEYSGIDADSHYNHPGVAITASTGDSGYGVSYPASSPYVTAVGGTSLTRSAGGRGWTETAWSGAGSGCSGYGSQPASQLNAATGCAKRAVADVSAVANPNTGVAVYNGGGWGIYGGTSASSPIIAAVYALAGTPGAGDYPNSYPYQNSGALNDVTAGSNGSCPVHQWCAAGIGWDGPTGLGTPNSAAAFSATGQVSGSPAKFGAIGQVTGPVIAGLATPIGATPMLPDGDALAGISWKPARTDCTVAVPNALQTTLSCPASAVGTSTVSATLTDTRGASKLLTLPVVFSTSPVKRAVSISYDVAGQSGGAESICTGAISSLRAVVTDVATGSPVRGLTLTFSRQAGTAPAVTSGSALTGPDGSALTTVSGTTALTLGAKSTALGAFAANPGVSLSVTASKCVATLTGAADRNTSYYADPVTVTGMLTRDASGQQVPLSGAAVQVIETVAGRAQLLATATSGSDGSVKAVLHPVASGTLSLQLPATTGWSSVTAPVGALTVLTPITAITGTANLTDVGFGDPVQLSGTLTRIAGAVTSPLAPASVLIRSTPASGPVVVLGSATVASNGNWTATVRPRASGELTASYLGAPGLPATSVDVGPLQVGTWTTAVSLSVQLAQQQAGAANKVTGVVTRSYNGTSGPAPSVPVGIYLQTSTGASLLLTTLSTTGAGSFTGYVAPAENGTLVARIVSLAGYTNANSLPSPVSVSTRITASAPSVVLAGNPVSFTGMLTAPRAGTVSVDELVGGNWVSVLTSTASSAGRVSTLLTGLAAGSYTFRLSFAGDGRGGAGSSLNLPVIVR
jgi:hypothetical protein